jgi:sulfate permease, SulP family
MPSSTTRAVGPTVKDIGVSALENLEGIDHRLKDGGITLPLSGVKDPVMDRLNRSHFPKELTGRIHLTQFDAFKSINPALAAQTLESPRTSDQKGT